jgi:uncharacterized membrane protein
MRGRYLEDFGDRIVLRPAPDDGLALGALLAFVIAPSVLIAASFGAWLVAGDEGLYFFAGWIAGAFFAAILAIAGLVRMARGNARAKAGEIRIDLSERLLDRNGAAPEVLSGIERVSVRRGGGIFGGWRLELDYEDGRRRSILTAPYAQGAALARAAEHLGDALSIDTSIAEAATRARTLAERDPKLAAAIAYTPIDPVLIAVSLWLLMTSLDPFVRFHAKQSLALVMVEALAALLAIGCCGAPIALLMPDGAEIIGVYVALALVLFVRVIVRLLGAYRAKVGAIWIMPWLGPIAARWAPPPPSQHAPAA